MAGTPFLYSPSATRVLFLIVVLLSNIVAASDNCNGTVIPLPVTDVKLRNGATRRGVKVTLGTPPQTLSVIPETWGRPFQFGTFRGDRELEYCGNEVFLDSKNGSNRCLTKKGGTFKSSASSTYLDLDGAGGPKDQDVLNIGDWSLDKYVFSMDFGFEQNNFGMTPDSKLLQQLVDAEIIGSKSWGWDHGTTGGSDAKAVDGLMTIGGWDESRVEGEMNVQPLEQFAECILAVYVESMTLTTASGTSVPVISTKQGACIVPGNPFIRLPDAIFNATINGDYRNNTDYRYDFKSSIFPGGFKDAPPYFDGTLTIKLTSGFETTISASELSKPYLDILPFGTIGTPTSSGSTLPRVMTIAPTDNNSDRIILGAPFLTATYMFVNYDATNNNSTLHLGKAARSASASASLRPVLPANCDATSPSKKDSNPSTGVIVGIVAGVVGFLVLCGLVFWFFCYHRRKQRTDAVGDDVIDNKAELDADEVLKGSENPLDPKRAEMSGDTYERVEIDDNTWTGGISSMKIEPVELAAIQRHEMYAGYDGREKGPSDISDL